MLTNQDVLRIATEQSAVDSGCLAEDFLCGENRVVVSKEHPDARKYLSLPHVCNLISYGQNIVASTRAEYRETVVDYISRFPAEHCFETPNLHVLNDAFRPLGFRACFMAEYFLPDIRMLKILPCPFETRILLAEDFAELYTGEWDSALSPRRPELDVLGIGAYDKGELIGLAACSADCETMWQIGVDVRKAYRRRGIASAMTSRLALEILERGKVPFYCCAWSNIGSAGNAFRSGFRPAWAELTFKPEAFVDALNGIEAR